MKTFFILISVVIGQAEATVVPRYENNVTQQFQTRDQCEQWLLKHLDKFEGSWIASGTLGKTLYTGYGTRVGSDIATAITRVEVVID